MVVGSQGGLVRRRARSRVKLEDADDIVLSAAQEVWDDLSAPPPDDFAIPPEWFHEFQTYAWNSTAWIIAVLAGWQSGKTVFGPWWLRREIQRCGPGDYGVGAPTFRLMDKKVLPEFLACFKGLGTYNKSEFIFTFSDEGCRRMFGRVPDVQTKVFFGYAQNPDSLESATYKAFWADECGQDAFKAESFETIKSRVMVHRGRILLTSRPYNFDWYKTEIHDRADRKIYQDENSGQTITEEITDAGYIEVISFPSTANPVQDLEAIAREKERMAPWKFRMKYGGAFTKPAGAIYDCFENAPSLFPGETNTCKRFAIPQDWPVTIGSDFGNVNTAALLSAAEVVDAEDDKGNKIRKETGRHFAFAAYKKAGRTNEEHAWGLRAMACGLDVDFEDAFSRWEKSPERRHRKAGDDPPKEIAAVLSRCYLHPVCVGGSHQEQGWRDAYRLGGLTVLEPPVSDVEVGISCGYEGIKTRRFVLFEDLARMDDGTAGPISQLENYSRKLDDDLEPTEEIVKKATWHFCDAYRYLATRLFPSNPKRKIELTFY